MLAYYLFKIGRALSGFLPLWLGYRLCDLAGSINCLLDRSARRSVRNNLSQVLGTGSKRELRPAVRAVFKNTARNYYDLLTLAHLSREEVARRVQVFGMENLDRALERGKGAILLSAHLGNFNVVAPLALGSYPASIVVENVQPPELLRMVTELRETLGVRLIPLSGLALRTVYRALSHNEIVGIMGDRDVLGNGTRVQFFGRPASMPDGPVAIALRTGAAIVPAYTIRVSGRRSIGYVESPIFLQPNGDFRRDVQEGTQRLASILEGYIRRAPEQWTVLQDIWDPSSDGSDGKHLDHEGRERTRNARKAISWLSRPFRPSSDDPAKQPRGHPPDASGIRNLRV